VLEEVVKEFGVFRHSIDSWPESFLQLNIN